jgi:hypothetical protein
MIAVFALTKDREPARHDEQARFVSFLVGWVEDFAQ